VYASPAKPSTYRSIVEDSKGHLWLSSAWTGVHRFDPATGTFAVYQHSDKAGSLNNDSVNAVCVDHSGMVWVGTQDGGATRLADGKFTTYTTREGLPSNAVSGITANEQGRIWALSGERIVEWNGRGFQPASVPASLRFLTPEWTTDVFWAIDGRRMARFSRGVLTTHELPGDLIDRIADRVEEDSAGTIWMIVLKRAGCLPRFGLR
jgi:ligand-binding sensor domain-containing protein